MRNQINLTNEQIEAAFDEQGYGVDADSLVYTSETFADFLASREGWADKGRIEEQTDSVLRVARCQIAKGQPRVDLVVIDFGAARACYK
jgi:hypothetical protein